MKRSFLEDGVVHAEWWHRLEDGRIQCDLCPRTCRLRPGQHGFCFVRQARGSGLVLTSYGRNTGVAVDPMEKKPLYHFLPATNVLSFGTAGCNLGCRFCQNWTISKSPDMVRLSTHAMPSDLVGLARARDCEGIAVTYNDPIVFAEYAIDTAIAAREGGIKSIAVTAGYINEEPRLEFFQHFDAANVDLKGFTEEFNRKTCAGHLDPVLRTLLWLAHETDVWLEITTLLIPGLNDGQCDIARESDWILENLGPGIPLHFSGFHPDFRMRDTQPTPFETLARAREQAVRAGLNFVYTGNVFDPPGSSTYCPRCHSMLIRRSGYQVTGVNLSGDGACHVCGHVLPGEFGSLGQGRRGRPSFGLQVEEG